eukprot:scaffold102452_cov19-Tisochrysis_lutea.AAC.1
MNKNEELMEEMSEQVTTVRLQLEELYAKPAYLSVLVLANGDCQNQQAASAYTCMSVLAWTNLCTASHVQHAARSAWIMQIYCASHTHSQESVLGKFASFRVQDLHREL